MHISPCDPWLTGGAWVHLEWLLASPLTPPSFSLYLCLNFFTWLCSACLLTKLTSLLTNDNKTHSQRTEGHPTSLISKEEIKRERWKLGTLLKSPFSIFIQSEVKHVVQCLWSSQWIVSSQVHQMSLQPGSEVCVPGESQSSYTDRNEISSCLYWNLLSYLNIPMKEWGNA